MHTPKKVLASLPIPLTLVKFAIKVIILTLSSK